MSLMRHDGDGMDVCDISMNNIDRQVIIWLEIMWGTGPWKMMQQQPLNP